MVGPRRLLRKPTSHPLIKLDCKEPKPAVRSAVKWNLASFHESPDRIHRHAYVGRCTVNVQPRGRASPTRVRNEIGHPGGDVLDVALGKSNFDEQFASAPKLVFKRTGHLSAVMNAVPHRLQGRVVSKSSLKSAIR
jgi:hypothetical protein